MKNLGSINVFTDGGSRGNPGESAYGFYIETTENVEIISVGKRLGITTNNVAEYTGILESLKWVFENLTKENEIDKINYFMDSNLAVNQLNGIYKIKNAKLREILFEIKSYENQIKSPIIYKHVRREYNKTADKLVNDALDFKI